MEVRKAYQTVAHLLVATLKNAGLERIYGVVVAEDTAGSGHSWRLTDDQPWRRAYVVIGADTPVPFTKTG